MAQLVTRVDDDLAAAVDELVAAGVGRHPQTAGEIGWAAASSVRMIAEEPW